MKNQFKKLLKQIKFTSNLIKNLKEKQKKTLKKWERKGKNVFMVFVHFGYD